MPTKKKPVTQRASTAKRQAAERAVRKRRSFFALMALALIIVAALAFMLSQSKPGRLVTFHDRGEDHVILTRATTVKAAIEDAGITVAPQDVVEPAIGSELASSDSAVIIYRSRPVLVVDGSFRQKIITPLAAPNEIALAAGTTELSSEDKASIAEGSLVADGASQVLTITRKTPIVAVPEKKPTANPLTASKGAHVFVDSNGVAHRETYYDLPMNVVIGACGPGDYTIRYDGAKIDKDGYVLVAANYRAYPKCSVVETSMGPGKVYDTGGFALRYPHGFDLATDWTNFNGR